MYCLAMLQPLHIIHTAAIVIDLALPRRLPGQKNQSWMKRGFDHERSLRPTAMDAHFQRSSNDGSNGRSSSATNASLAQLLHSADALSTTFNSLHSSSFSYVQSIASAFHQLTNLGNVVDERMVTRSRDGEGGSALREMGMMKVQEVIEEGLRGVREELAKMEACVEQLYVRALASISISLACCVRYVS